MKSVEVHGRSGVVIRWLDKISSESAPTGKASTSNTMFSKRKTLFLECNMQNSVKVAAQGIKANIFRGHSTSNACQDLFHFLLFFLLFLPYRVSSDPSRVFQTLRPPFYILSGSEGALGAKKQAAT